MKFLIFSLDTAVRQPAKDEYNTMKTHMLTSRMFVSDARGAVKGQETGSFICLIDKEIQDKMIMGIAHAYKQESVLEVILPSKKAYLRFVDGRPSQYMGVWSEVNPGAEIKGDFTYNLENMKVYQCIDKAENA